MRLPKRNIGPWARELIDECFTSREARRDLNKMWCAYFYAGTSDGIPAIYNRTFSHVDRLASFLFSPTDARFALEGDHSADDKDLDLLASGSRYLNREF